MRDVEIRGFAADSAPSGIQSVDEAEYMKLFYQCVRFTKLRLATDKTMKNQ